MPDDRWVKQVVFEKMEGSESNRRQKLARRWTDDADECCNNDLYTLSEMEADRTKWWQIVKRIDTNGY